MFILKNAGLFGTEAGDVFQVCPGKFCRLYHTCNAIVLLSMHQLCTGRVHILAFEPHAFILGFCHTIQKADALQVIDTGNSKLQNVITFKNGATFVVDSTLEAGGDKRLVFKFTGAKLNLPSRTWRLPPFGKGW